MKEHLQHEEAWLEQLQASKLIGICIIDKDGRAIQQFSDDPILRQLVLEHQEEIIRMLRIDERLVESCVTRHEDVILLDDATEMLDFRGAFEQVKAHRSAPPTPDSPPPDLQ